MQDKTGRNHDLLKTTKPVLSVIIPVYNTPDDTFDRMIQSVLNQEGYSEENPYEIIIIDDGSERNCAEHLEAIAKTSDNIIVKHIPNGGVSNARNLGIQLAQGEYITFVDADDYLAESFFIMALEIAHKYDADIVYGNFESVPDVFSMRKQNLTSIDCRKGEMLDDIKAALLGYAGGSLGYTIYPGPCGRIFRSEKAKRVAFKTELRYCEDYIFNFEMLNISDIAVCTPYTWYYYVQNSFSVTHKKSNPNFNNDNQAVFNMLDVIHKNDSSYIRRLARIDAMDKYGYFVLVGYIRTHEKWKKTHYDMKRNMEHPYIREAIQFMAESKPYMSKAEKVQYYLMRYHQYFLMYLGLKVIYRHS